MFMQRIKRRCARSREKYRPRRDRASVRHAVGPAGLLQGWPAGSGGRWFGYTGPGFDPRFRLARGEDSLSRLSPDTIFRDARNARRLGRPVSPEIGSRLACETPIAPRARNGDDAGAYASRVSARDTGSRDGGSRSISRSVSSSR